MKTHRNGITRKGTTAVAAKRRGKKPGSASLQERCQRLERAQRRLRKELKEASAERDQYRKSLIAAMVKTMKPIEPPTWEEVQAQLAKYPSIEEYLNQLEADMAEWERKNVRR